jgi:NDP-sugar pyrophosphorylase family protein
VTAAARLCGGIIAAGEGSRLREAGFSMPKPLVPVAGVPLIGAVIDNFVAADVTSLVIIVNEGGRACVDWVRERFPHLDIEFVVKTTRSSLESFREVSRRLSGPRALISTVDSWCRPAAFARFVDAARQRPEPASVLAVTPLVDDDHPLWVRAGADGRVASVGDGPAPFVTAGVYLLAEAAWTMAAPPSLGRLREFLAWLVGQGHPVYAETIETVVDVDRASDVALAEALARAGRES